MKRCFMCQIRYRMSMKHNGMPMYMALEQFNSRKFSSHLPEHVAPISCMRFLTGLQDR